VSHFKRRRQWRERGPAEIKRTRESGRREQAKGIEGENE
jgi:hypothetical protein